jgi:cephalosporin-C deacetylase-like acetyl esterase
MQRAMGPIPDSPCPLDPEIRGTIDRSTYRIENVVFRSRPGVYVTSNLYIPTNAKGKRPAVLVVHGHWAGARRDPTVQARCLGLVQLGFVVLAVDAFGSGERYSMPARGTYHGALYGSTLWPSGHTLLGMQVYDNRRAVDYLQSRAEVDGDRIGVTGASGGGNQTMYAGAMDERIKAVVPVCSVGNYQAYLHAACCVCEVLPGALTFCEEGDVLGMVAPRALMVINASRDSIQFSPNEAIKSIERATAVFRLFNVADQIRHVVFESAHDYNKPMREAMYGFMTQYLTTGGDGKPIPEPPIAVESPEDLACYPDTDDRPDDFLTPPSFATDAAHAVLARTYSRPPTHAEEWESTAVASRRELLQLLGGFPKVPRLVAKVGTSSKRGDGVTIDFELSGEGGLPIPLTQFNKATPAPVQPTCILVHLDGRKKALEHPLAAAFVRRNWLVVAPELRATGEYAPSRDQVRTTSDHNSAEHGLWVGRPLLGQWVFDIRCLMEWLSVQPGFDRRKVAVVGLGQAGLVAIASGALMDDRFTSVVTVGAPVSYVPYGPYPDGTRMGLLVPGLFKAGDVPHLAGLIAPRRLIVADGMGRDGKKLFDRPLHAAYAFTESVYKAHRVIDQLTVTTTVRPDEIIGRL